MSTPSELREALEPHVLREMIRRQVLIYEQLSLNGKPVDVYVVIDAILDAVTASLPKPTMPKDYDNYEGYSAGVIAGTHASLSRVHQLLQSAKSTSKESE